MPQYLIKFEFFYAKPGRAVSSIVGGSGDGEIDITTEKSIKDMKSDPELIDFIKSDVQGNPKLKNKGVVFEVKIKTLTK